MLRSEGRPSGLARNLSIFITAQLFGPEVASALNAAVDEENPHDQRREEAPHPKRWAVPQLPDWDPLRGNRLRRRHRYVVSPLSGGLDPHPGVVADLRQRLLLCSAIGHAAR